MLPKHGKNVLRGVMGKGPVLKASESDVDQLKNYAENCSQDEFNQLLQSVQNHPNGDFLIQLDDKAADPSRRNFLKSLGIAGLTLTTYLLTPAKAEAFLGFMMRMNKKAKVLTTFTFPAGTSTWTAPAGVTSLVSAVGKGSDGYSDYGYELGFAWVITSATGSGPQTGPLSWSIMSSYITNFVNTINAPGTGPVTLTTSGIIHLIYPDNTWDSVPNGNVSGGRSNHPSQILTDIVWVRGSAHTWTTGSGSSSGNATYASGNGTFKGAATIQGAAGTATTGFSLSFAGGSYASPNGNPASNTTYNDVSVTPGTIYTITNNGALTISYYL